MKITLSGTNAVVASKFSDLAGAFFLRDLEGGLPVRTIPRNGVFVEGHVGSASRDGSTVDLVNVTEYSPCDHPGGHGLHTRTLEDGKTVGIDTLELTITLPYKAKR